MRTPTTDQELFDQEVASRGKVVLEALAGLGIVAALLMSLVALIQSTEHASTGAPAAAVSVKPAVAQAAGGPARTAPAAAVAAAPANVPTLVTLKVIPEGKKGPEGKLHDDFTVTNFNVKVGQPVTLRIDNTDQVPHSISSPEAGVNIIVQPGTHDYTLQVNQAGRFEWRCMFPCDPWSMEHAGYMRGFITATAS
jgi:plastocyanin